MRAAGRLAEMGADIIEDVPMPNTRYGIPVYFVISRVEAASNLHRYDGVKYGYRTPETGQAICRRCTARPAPRALACSPSCAS